MRSATDDAAFRAAMDDAKGRRNLSDVIGRHTKLRKRGAREMVGICPFHSERTPSFEVNDAKGTFYCHGCGAGGDHFTILTKLDGLSFQQAFEALTNETFPSVSAEDRARQAAEDERERAAAIDEAREFWAGAVEVRGTPADRYLRQARGITAAAAPSLRFGHVPLSRDDDGAWRPAMPALLAAVTLLDNFVGMQRIFLREDGADKRWGKPRKSKFTMGRLVGGAVKMGRLTPDPSAIVITEGLEDALSLAQEMPEQQVWAALGTANLRMLVFPPSVRQIVLAGQNDAAGRAAIDAAATEYLDRGLVVRAMWPDPAFKDWNDELRGVRA